MTTTSDRSVIECRVIVIHPVSRQLLVPSLDGVFRPARVSIPRGTRPAREVCTALKDRWGAAVVILDFPLFDENRSACAIAELIGAEIPPSFSLIRLEQLPLNELSGQERAHLENLLEDRVNPGPLRIGWLDEARAWVQHATGRKHRAETGIEQYNAGRGFALIRFAMEDGHSYWLKATGNPNQHECGLTARLCELAPDCLPALVSIRREWNAWVSKDAGIPLCDTASPVILEFATCSLGFLQTENHG